MSKQLRKIRVCWLDLNVFFSGIATDARKKPDFDGGKAKERRRLCGWLSRRRRRIVGGDVPRRDSGKDSRLSFPRKAAIFLETLTDHVVLNVT